MSLSIVDDFGEFLKKKRLEMGLSQTDLGKMLGVTQNTISFWERGMFSPPFDNAKYIVFRLGGRVFIEDDIQRERADKTES